MDTGNHTEDPKAKKLIKLAKKYGCYGKHVELAVKLEEILFDKRIKMNMDGANAAILSDMGLNWKLGRNIYNWRGSCYFSPCERRA